VLEGLEHPQGLVDIAADGQVANRQVTQNTLVVYDVGGPERNAGIRAVLNKAAVVS